MKRGIIVGKFYPFHSGHAYLIETAKRQVGGLTVLVCDRSDQIFTGEERATWIREMFPDVIVRVIRDILDDENSERWARYTLLFLGYRPDVVFTSETYGDAYAEYLGAEHVLVDRMRSAVPISGTSVRENPYRAWGFLSPPVRARLVRRVVIVGAESTGKTTIARALAGHFATAWVPEFGRFYTEGKLPSGTEWKTEEFVFIAEGQNRLENAYARSANRVLFCDTNAWATRLWHERYMGVMDPRVDALARGRSYDLVLLTDIDTPFEQDGIRDGEHIRYGMHRRFTQLLEEENVPYVLLSGNHEARMKKAIYACERLLVSGDDIFEKFPAAIPVVETQVYN